MKVWPVHIHRISEDLQLPMEDLLAVEEPLEIRLVHGPYHQRTEVRLAVTMRTPGNDEQLVRGFLHSESIVADTTSIISIQHCVQVKPEEQGNVIRVNLAEDVEISSQLLQRNFYTTSSCGVCGKTSIEAVQCQIRQHQGQLWTPDAMLLLSLPSQIQSAQAVFKHTGGLHAAALFTSDGQLLVLHEDIGRHNAVDKVIGHALEVFPNVNWNQSILFVSGRAGFELVQKAAVMGIGAMLAIGAPSSLAVQLARKSNVYLAGFARDGRFNCYN